MNSKKIKYGLIGGGIGLLIGIVLFFVASYLATDVFLNDVNIYYTIGFPFVFSEGISRWLGLCNGWGCLFFNFIGGIILYGIIGGMIAFLIARKK